MNTSNASYLLNSLEAGLRTDSSDLIGLERNLSSMLHQSRKIGAEHGSPGDWISNCHLQWDNVENTLDRISERVDAMHEAIASSDLDRLDTAWEACETIESEEVCLTGELRTLRTNAIQGNTAAKNDWIRLALAIEFHLETIYACSDAVRIKLEVLKENSSEAAGVAAHDIPPSSRSGAMDLAKKIWTWEFDTPCTPPEREVQSVRLSRPFSTNRHVGLLHPLPYSG